MLDTASVVLRLRICLFSVKCKITTDLQRLCHRLQSAFVSFQEMSRYPLTFDQIPPLLVEPFILRGFRAIDQPWLYYCRSLLHKHNETMNVWTHLIGILYMIHLLFYYNQRLNFVDNAHAWPFAVSLFSAMLMFGCSAFAHLLHSKSESVHMTCFLIDYIGVSLHGFGSGFLQIYYSAPQWFYEKIEGHYICVLLLMGILCCLLNCFAQYYFERPYPPLKRICQFLPCGLLWLYSITPLCIRLFSSTSTMNPTLMCHLAQILLFVLGATLFGLDIPQRFCPGALDFFGQGHHLFHFCIYLITVCQMHGVYWDYQDYHAVISQRSKPELIFCAGSIVSLVAWDTVIVCVFRRRMKHKYHAL